jgi:hypothetical protein
VSDHIKVEVALRNSEKPVAKLRNDIVPHQTRNTVVWIIGQKLELEPGSKIELTWEREE